MKRVLIILLFVVVVPVCLYHWINSAPDAVEASSEFLVSGTDLEMDPEQDKPSPPPHDQIEGMITDELRIREIEPILRRLKRGFENLELINDQTRDLFVPQLSGFDVIRCQLDQGETKAKAEGKFKVELGAIDWSEGPQSVWQKLFAHVDYFQFVRIYPVKVLRGATDSFVLEAGFEALARTDNGWLTMLAGGELEFKHVSEQWKISKWGFNEFKLVNSAQRMFRETTDQVFRPDDREAVRRSVHYEILLDAIARGGRFRKPMYNRYFPRGGTNGRHPSLAVVDINQDGWDDLYVVEQWRPNMLFRNQQDGTFEEVASEYQLDIDGLGTSAIFADFDNDGDDDLFLGRSLAGSMYLENEQGKFVDKTIEKFGAELPYLATAVSVADFNNDGLLDIYLATYGFPAFRPRKWIGEFLAPDDQQEYLTRINNSQYQRFVNSPGPPNVLYENHGGKFVVSKFSDQIAVWANTFQGTWSDFDDDGDQDLYIANDFARDYLFRNDQQDGFKDVTFEVGDESMIGFGMGAAWGDYDRDGKIDLYVSNMYSKAGMRITQQFDQLDRRFRRSADGNRMYKNEDGKLKLVSANDGKGLKVHKAGWSWGGQFADFNNDGFLDLYVCSGYFTAPQLYATDVDI